MLRPGDERGRAIAVFPYLKTTHPITLGSFTFRSTADTGQLSEEDSAHVKEIAEMLFLKDDLRIRSATCAILPVVDLDEGGDIIRELERIQAIIAYCYSSLHQIFSDPFLKFEHASLAILSPEPVSIFLVRPDYHVEQTSQWTHLTEDSAHNVKGYYGRFNFSEPFWVVKGSRLYPPVPHITLNISQDLSCDLNRCFGEVPHHHLLPGLLREPNTATARRVFRSLAWYNHANSAVTDEDTSILHLAVAFETLLALPRGAKTDRFVDAVSLLLGRIARLGTWAEQFYSARCDVAHAGEAEQTLFTLAGVKSRPGSLYRPLLAYGRQVFQLCAGAVMFGTSLAVRSGLEEKLVTNQERFQTICRTLDDESLTTAIKFASVERIVSTVGRYRFVPETGLSIETMVGAVSRAAKALLSSGESLEAVFKARVENLANAPRSPDHYEALEALRAVTEERTGVPGDPESPSVIWRRLAEVVWQYVFMHYFWLKEQRSKSGGAGTV